MRARAEAIRKPVPQRNAYRSREYGGDWACHQLEHELGGLYDVAHGAGLAAIWGSWARYVYLENPERFAQFATNVFDIPCYVDFEKTALAGIEAMEDFFRSIEMPTSLRELGLDLSEKQIHELAFKCSLKRYPVPSASSNS